jgi:arylsulfatase A
MVCLLFPNAGVITPANQGHEYLYWEFHEGGFKQAVRWGDWKAVRLGAKSPLAIYDLKTDLGERQDVSSQHPEVAEKIEAILQSARTDSVEWSIRDTPPKRAGAKKNNG